MRMQHGVGRHAYRGGYAFSATSDYNDLFAINPLRRSSAIVATSWALILGPAYLMDGELRSMILIGLGWLAATGIIMCTPILLWCLVEEAVKAVRRRVTPPIDALDLSPRAYNLLHRHGFESIQAVDQAPDTSLMLLSNMDARALREIRRAISIWKYQRWQECGFPANEMP